MACQIKNLRLGWVCFFVSNLLAVCFGEPKVPCYFIFGDSLLDNGNNNFLNTEVKVDYKPYGIDFPQGPTGRFTNGRNIADFIAEYLGFPNYIPAFAVANGNDILTGVNYASGAAGILDESGQHLGDNISMEEQLENHRITIWRMRSILGLKKTKKQLSKCIYSVGIGSNDYINNYFLPEYYPKTSQKYTPDQYAKFLIQQFKQKLQKLYKYGARKVGVFELGEIGCAPFEMQLYGTNGTACVDKITTAVKLFNNRLVKLVASLNSSLKDAEFIFIPQISTADPSEAGFTVVNKPCCVTSGLTGKGHCLPDLTPCSNRNEYVYWDEFHPTELGMQILASYAIAAFNSSISAASAYILKTLNTWYV